MQFKAFLEDKVNASTMPLPEQVVGWLWMIDEAISPIVQNHGLKMINTYFASREAAEIYIALSGEPDEEN